MKSSKLVVMGLCLFVLSGCAMLHDGSGWEHNMDDNNGPILEHQH